MLWIGRLLQKTNKGKTRVQIIEQFDLMKDKCGRTMHDSLFI